MSANKYLLIFSLILLFSTAITATQAQEDAQACPRIVQTAITLTQERCETTSVNQICYGHLVLDSQPRPGMEEFSFTQPGDIVDVLAVQSLRLSAMDADTGHWGVVTMQIDARLVQNPLNSAELQILLFGDAELNDATQFLAGHVLLPANIRSQPTADSTLITSMEPGTEITANGRLEDSSWIRIYMPQASGWISADLVQLQGEAEHLTVITPSTPDTQGTVNMAQFGPMQAFMFNSGIDDAPCAEAPNSGLLIQTPEGVAAVTLWLDEVVIQLEATAFIQAAPNGSLTLNVLEGSAQVTALDDTRTVTAGMQLNVPLDENLSPADVPADPQPYTPESIANLPLDLLNHTINPAPPRSQPQTLPQSGTWQFTWQQDSLRCTDGTQVPFTSTGESSAVDVGDGYLQWNNLRYDQVSPGIYRSSYTDQSGNLHQDTLQVIAPDRIVGEKTLDLISPVCTLNADFQLQLLAPAD